MSYVAVYHVATPDTPNKVLTHLDDIASTLAEHGARFERWQPAAIEKGATDSAMMEAYKAPINDLGYANVEVLTVIDPRPPLAEQRCREAHAHFFIAGQGLFSLHVGDYVYSVRCEKNDLLVIPAGMAHWFDQGEHGHFVMLRLFNSAEGAKPALTGDTLAERFPGLDD
ncbi:MULTISPECIES: acireductone dioxygenase [Pseudomonas]|uniref:acireductone dioxygenase n=1 Tax=Pseudomonas TaxID=286 RepID=UPI00054B2589|nr:MULTISPECIES: acireductone dioxygenase [Pseudomonas]PHN40761.1 acireductone dioxygenase [Pseudomonas sp. ICMP 564]